MNRIILLAAVAFMCVACESEKNIRGTDVSDELKAMKIGKTHVSEIIERCGMPSLRSDKLTMIYVSNIANVSPFSAPELQNQKTVIIKIDENGILRNIDIRDANYKVATDQNVAKIASTNKDVKFESENKSLK